MNTFGRLFRVSIYGESHNKSTGVIVDGCPSGIGLDLQDFVHDLSRRKGGGKATTERVEEDIPNIQSGVFEGRTTGSPILITFENKNTDPSAYDKNRYIPRPGHSDLTAYYKYHGHNDHRGGGHSSGRLTVGLVAAGVIARKILGKIRISCNIKEIGGQENYTSIIDKARNEGDSLGGILECRAENVPIGMGEPFFDSVESILAHMIFAVPGIKGIEFGSGFHCASMKGSEFNDEICDKTGATFTNNSGGINAGISNGNDIVFRVAVRPTPSIKKGQRTVNMKTMKREILYIEGRHDICFCLRMPVIIEAVTAIAIADLSLLSGVNNQ